MPWYLHRQQTIVGRCYNAAARLQRLLARWYWRESDQGWHLRVMPWGRARASVWTNGTWHTWDADSCGGENDVVDARFVDHHEELAYAAKRRAWDSAIKQGFL